MERRSTTHKKIKDKKIFALRFGISLTYIISELHTMTLIS